MSLKLSKNLFFFTLVFSPIAFGTTEPWSYAIMETATVLACLFFFFSILKHKSDLYQVPGLTPLVLFLCFILVQLIPLPPFIVQLLSPNAFKIHEATKQLSQIDSWMTISLNHKATLSEFFRYTTYALFYALTVQLLRKKEMLQATGIIITIFGGLLAFSSILQFYLTEDVVLWFRRSPYNSIAVGPYANHNHYAGLMEMIFPIVLALFLFYRPRIGKSSLVRGIIEIFSNERANIHILIGTSALLIVVSIFVSLSRGAMISSCLSLIFFTIFLFRRKISKGNTILMIGVIILTSLIIGWFGWDQIFQRFASLKNAQGIIYESRLDFWKDTKDIVTDYKITGSGMGTFRHIYPSYQSFTIGNDRSLNHAHNDYLELLSEGGTIGFILAGCFLVSVLYKTYAVFKKRRDAFSIYLYIGCITALVSILLHSFVDFNMHIGANGLWFFLIAGIAVSAANTGIRKQSKPTRLVPVTSNVKKWSSCICITIFSILASVYNISNLLGIFYYSNIKNYVFRKTTPIHIMQKIDSVAGFASRIDPLTADYPFLRANLAWLTDQPETAKHFFIKSIRLDPLNAYYLNRFGLFLREQKNTKLAGITFKKSMIYDQTYAEYIYQYANWLLSQNNFELGLKHMRQVLMLNETYFDKVLTAMIVAGIPKKDLEQTIPDMPGPTIEYAKYLNRIGLVEDAKSKLIYTLDLLEVSSQITQQTTYGQKQHLKDIKNKYVEIYQFFKKKRDTRNTMTVLKRAEMVLPFDASIKVKLGDLYYDLGIFFKAQDKYEHALLLDPGNKRALSMLKKINP